MNSKMSNKMCCWCVVISLITLVLVCVLVYQSFKPQIDGFDNHPTASANSSNKLNKPNTQSRNDIIMNQLGNTFYNMCVNQMQDNPEQCCNFLSDPIRNTVAECSV